MSAMTKTRILQANNYDYTFVKFSCLGVEQFVLRLNYNNSLLNKNRRYEYFTGIMIFVIILLAWKVMLQCHGYVHINSMRIYEQSPPKNGSLFGYSLAYQPGIQRLIITAPQENNIGEVYTTAINSSNIVNLNLDPETFQTPPDITHDFWFGANVKANSKFFITCAPRYAEKKTRTRKFMKKPLKLPATGGACIRNDYIDTDKYKSKMLKFISQKDRIKNTKEFGQMLDTFGWSIDITKSDQVLVGSPAMSTGRVVFYKNTTSEPFLLNKVVPEGYNFGYSLTSGSFFNQSIVYTISATFGNGKVYFYNLKHNNVELIENTEVGSMFGAALCAARLGASALLVGAPTYSANAYNYDRGAVYVYVDQTDEGSMQMLFKRAIKGPLIGSYFGHAIENLGDIDGDGKDEIVIAAPFENGIGAVYIYSGASILDEKTAPIRIQPKNFQSFGFSLAIVEDTDGNGSNELAIGSPTDNKVLVFNTFAFIKVILSAELRPKTNSSDVDYVLEYCIETHLKQKNMRADLLIRVELRNAKLEILDEAKNAAFETILPLSYHSRENKSCEQLYLHIQTDKLTTSDNKLMSYNITALLKEDPQKMTKFDPFRVLISETQSVLNVYGQKRNHNTSIDEPKLSLNITSSITQPYMIGSSYLESLTLSVLNDGGAAQKPCMKVYVEGTHVIAYPRSCTLAADGLLCRYNQVLRNNSVWRNFFKIDTKYLTSIHKSLTIRCELYPHCDGENKKPYVETIELKPYNNMIKMKGQSNPGRIVNMTIDDLQKGKSLEHVYTIYNYGLTNWVGVKSEMILPKSSYVHYIKTPIKVYTYTSSNEYGIVNNSEDKEVRVLCEIGNMKKQEKVIVVIAIAIVPGALEFERHDQNITITTSLNLLLQDKVVHLSVNTTLTFATAEVPVWVTLTSSFVGIFLMIILSYILYEYGFLQRKTKDKLIQKKQEVYVESVRRSMMCANMREEVNRERDRRKEFQKQEDEDSV